MAGHVELFVKDTKKRHRQKSPLPEGRNLLEVVGHSFTIVEDEALVAYLDSAESLLPWVGDPELQIDRYDARHLLSDSSAFKRRGKEAWGGDDDVEEEELDRERYFDLENEPGTAEYLEELEEEGLKRQKVDGTGYKSVAFSYEASAEPPQVQTTGDAKEPSSAVEAPPALEYFRPPYPVPQELQDKMPITQKHHQVMLHTAKFVHTHGGQTEIVLRVKQGDNPRFSFLLPEDPLHPFFRFMVENYERLAAAVQGGNGSGLEVGLGAGLQNNAVSLVAAAYGEDEDGSEPDEGGDGKRQTKKLEGEGSLQPETGLGSEEAGAVSKPPVAESGTWLSSVKPIREGEEMRAEGVGLESSAEETKKTVSLESKSGVQPEKPATEEVPLDADVQNEKVVSDNISPNADVRNDGATLAEVPSSADVQGQDLKPPPAPAVRFAIAKNPPLAVIRKVKQDSTAAYEVARAFEIASDGEEVSADGGTGEEAGPSESPREASPAVEKHSNPPSGVNEPLTPGVNGPLIPGGIEPSTATATKPLSVIDKGPLESGEKGPLVTGVNEPPASGVNTPPAALAAGVNEPPLQTKRVIEKMVEFIAKNGKQFEAAVRKKDGPEGRFPFLVPGHTYHSYYETLLDRTLGMKASEEPGSSKAKQPPSEASFPGPQSDSRILPVPANSVGAPTDSAPEYARTDSTDTGGSDEGERASSGNSPLFFGENDEDRNGAVSRGGVPVGLGSDAVRAAVMAATRRGSFGSHTQLAGLENRERKLGFEKVVRKRSVSPLGDLQPAGLNIDQVRAAVMRATRTPSPSIIANPEAKEVKPSGLGIDAVRQAVARATRGNAVSNHEASGAAVQKPPNDSGDQPLEKQGLLVAGNAPLSGPVSGNLAATHSGAGALSDAAAAALAAAAAAAEEADSSHARLTAAEKKRAERLKRAKMFSAMLQGGTNGGAADQSNGGASGSVGRGGSELPRSNISGAVPGADVAAAGAAVTEAVPADVSSAGGSLPGEAAGASVFVGADLAATIGKFEPEEVGAVAEEWAFVQVAEGSVEEGEILGDGEATSGLGDTQPEVVDGMKRERDESEMERDKRAEMTKGEVKVRKGSEKRREPRASADKSDGGDHRRRRDRESREERGEVGEGAVGSDGERRRRRRHRTADDAGEDREERRRRRRERREKRARDEERCETALNGEDCEGRDIGCENRGGGREREKEERRRRPKERHRERAEPEEGEICEDGAGETDENTARGCHGAKLPEGAGEVLRKGERAVRRTEGGRARDEAKRARKRDRSSSREKDGERYSGVRHAGENSLVDERTAEKGKSGLTERHDGIAETATERSVAGVLEAGSASASEAKADAGGFEVPESVRAKVRAMLGFM